MTKTIRNVQSDTFTIRETIRHLQPDTFGVIYLMFKRILQYLVYTIFGLSGALRAIF